MTATNQNLPFILSGLNEAPLNFSDGVTQAIIGYPLSKVVFFQVTSFEDTESGKKELRKVSQVLSIPTLQLIEACKNILSLAKNVEPQLEQLGSKHQANIHTLLDGVSPSLPPGMTTQHIQQQE